MSKDNCLIIFSKNLVKGKVKTRLAATIGDEGAFEIYTDLLEYTWSVTNDVNCDKVLYYSDYVETDDIWTSGYKKVIQHGNDLGTRMANAFNDVFDMGYNKAIIIGTDCPEITSAIIKDAFAKLDHSDVVLGPSADGGYYLLGMKQMHPQLFNDIKWSTGTVFNGTTAVCDLLQLQYTCLQLLHDVDEEKDLCYLKTVKR